MHAILVLPRMKCRNNNVWDIEAEIYTMQIQEEELSRTCLLSSNSEPCGDANLSAARSSAQNSATEWCTSRSRPSLNIFRWIR